MATLKTKKKKFSVPTDFTGKYNQSVGGRKTSTAEVRIYSKQSGLFINGQDYKKYFPHHRQQQAVIAPLEITEMKDSIGVSARVVGGGITGQAEAVRHGLAKALVEFNPELKKKLKREGFITRDPRAVERKKYGLKKARRAPQWSKR